VLRRLLIGTCLLIMSGNASTSAAESFTRGTFQTSDRVNLSVIEAGSRHTGSKQPTLALIPGWCMPASLWRRQLEEQGRRYHTLALDPRGQGESELPERGFTAERRATDVHEFLQPFSRVLLVGWSLGAIESLQYIDMYSAERIAGLVIVDSSVGEQPAAPPDGTFINELRKDRDKALDGFVHAIFKTRRTDAEINELIRAAKRMTLEDSIALLSYPFPRTHWKEITHSFTKPLLYVVTPQFEAQARNLQKSRPRTQVEIFREAGHALFVDEPDRFNTLVKKFADRLIER
jgi:non-heme chloroperoxidase